MLYFAYGSNLSPRQMAERCPGHAVVGVAALPDHRLEFRGRSERWGGAVATVVPTHAERVWGVLYELNIDHMRTLDEFEGFLGPGNQHNVYDREWVTVDLTRTFDGSIPRKVRALTYVGRFGGVGKPSRRYLDTILEGARHHALQEEYVAKLAATPVEEEATT